MASFKDIKFSKHSTFKGIHGTYSFNNGITIAVIAGEYARSIPRMNLSHESQYRGFEVLVVDRYGNTIINDLPLGPHVLSNATPEEITSLMESIESNQNK